MSAVTFGCHVVHGRGYFIDSLTGETYKDPIIAGEVFPRNSRPFLEVDGIDGFYLEMTLPFFHLRLMVSPVRVLMPRMWPFGQADGRAGIKVTESGVD